MSTPGEESDSSEEEEIVAPPPKKRGRRSQSQMILGMKYDGIPSVTPSPDSTDRKKQTHLRCERQRREAINYGYTELKNLLPSNLSPLGCKTTNASILYRTCDYMKQLQGEQRSAAAEAAKLKAQVVALNIISQQYEELANDHDRGDNKMSGGQMSTPQKQFAAFRTLVDNWSESFDRDVIVDDYPSLTRTLLQWLEHSIDFHAAPSIATTMKF